MRGHVLYSFGAVVLVGGNGQAMEVPLQDVASLLGPRECRRWRTQQASRIWADLEPLAQHGPITLENITEIPSAYSKINGWQMYFAEVGIIDGRIFLRHNIRVLGWLAATLKLIKESIERYGKKDLPDVLFVLSVHDEVLLEKTRFKALPLLSTLTSSAHWDIPIPGQTWFESTGGISSHGIGQDFSLWESSEWQNSLETKYPWSERSDKAFFRGHDWSSSNSFTELLKSRPKENCIPDYDVSMSFPYRRWYAELSSSDLSSFLDVGLTGAPDYVKAQYPNQKYVTPVSLPEHAKYKYLLHLDGTSGSNRLLKLLLMGSVVLKQDSIFEEYFYKDLMPYVHFVPIARDRCSTGNLTSTLEWLRSHDQEAQTIAKAGQRYAREHLSRAAAACYWRRVLSSYAALQTFHPKSVMNFSEWFQWT